MSLKKEEFARLKKLGAVEIDPSMEPKFISNVDSILGFVGQLEAVDVEWITPMSHPLESKTLEPSSGVEDFWHSNLLLQNVKHNLQDNGIVIKSPIKS